MNQFIRSARLPAVVLATILTAGIFFAWVFAILLGQVIVQMFPTRTEPYESLSMTRDGKPYIQWHDEDGTNRWRTLEGQPIDDIDYFKPVSPATPYGAPEMLSLRAPDEEPKKSQAQLDWSQRIVGFRDHSSPPNYWYLMRDKESNGLTYLVGYDSRSKRIVGYIGRAGFRPDAPPEDDRFPACVADNYTHSAAYGTEPSTGPAVDSLVFFISEGQLMGLDIDRRAVRTIPLPGGAITLDDYQEMLLQVKDLPDGASPSGTSATASRTAVRTAEEVVILDSQGNTIRRQPIPKLLQDKALSLYLCEKELVFRTGMYPMTTGPDTLYWVNEKGEISRQAEVRLIQQGVTNDPRMEAWQSTAMMPVPGFMAIGTFVLTPWNNVASGAAPDYFAALGKSTSDVWPAFLALLAVGGLLAVLVYRRHQRVSPKGAATWAVFVLLGGIPGVIAYWVHRRWPAMEKCVKCGELAPRDRESCLACSEGFALPRRLGSEIFA